MWRVWNSFVFDSFRVSRLHWEMRNDDEKDLHVLMAFEIRLSTKRSVYMCVFRYCISWSSSMSTMNFLISVLLHLLLVEWQSKCGGTHAAVELGSVCTRKTNGSRRAYRRTDVGQAYVRSCQATIWGKHTTHYEYSSLRPSLLPLTVGIMVMYPVLG